MDYSKFIYLADVRVPAQRQLAVRLLHLLLRRRARDAQDVVVVLRLHQQGAGPPRPPPVAGRRAPLRRGHPRLCVCMDQSGRREGIAHVRPLPPARPIESMSRLCTPRTSPPTLLPLLLPPPPPTKGARAQPPPLPPLGTTKLKTAAVDRRPRCCGRPLLSSQGWGAG